MFGQLSQPCDAVLLANATDPHIDQSFFYLFDVPSGIFEGSVAIAHPDGSLTVLSSPLEEESALQAAKSDPSVRVVVPTNRGERDTVLQSTLPGTPTIGLNYRELTHEWFLALQKALPNAQWLDVSAAVRAARMVKDGPEIERLRTAAQIGSKVAVEIPGLLTEGMTELELAAEMEYRMNRHGAAGRSFATITAFGPASAEPHYAPSHRRLTKGTSIVCDFGALYRRYASDITRSFRFGPGDREMKAVHEKVQEAQSAALATVRDGALAKEVHGAAQAVIDASPWKGRFTHGLGHSIGLAVHDGFGMNLTVDEPLRAGMTITIEPGIYLPGKGGVRIEDDILVTKSGYEWLTEAPRGYLEVGA